MRALYLVELVLQAHELQVQPPPFRCNLPWRWTAEQLARALFGAARPAVGVAWQEGNSAIAVCQDGWVYLMSELLIRGLQHVASRPLELQLRDSPAASPTPVAPTLW